MIMNIIIMIIKILHYFLINVAFLIIKLLQAGSEEEKLKSLEKAANAKKKEEAKLKKALEGLEEDLSDIQMKVQYGRFASYIFDSFLIQT